MKKAKIRCNVEKDKIHILVVDDHPIVREGLAELLNHEPDMVVSAKAGNAAEAMNAVKKHQIDLAIVDMLLKKTTGIQVIKKIKIICPDILFLIFSMSDNSQYVKQAIEAGAMGYITKDEISEKIVNAIRQALKGQIYISSKLHMPKKELNALLADRVQKNLKQPLF